MFSKTMQTDLTAFEVFLSLRNQRHPFILDSGMDSEKLGRYSFVGGDPFLTFSSKGDRCRIHPSEEMESIEVGDPFAILQQLLTLYPAQSKEGMPFVGGAVGYFGYELCHFLENLPSKAIDDMNIADCFFGFYDGIYVFDHQKGTIDMVALGIKQPENDTLLAMETHLQYLSVQRPQIPPYHSPASVSFNTNMTKEAYLESIHRIKEYIRAGDVYQVNFTQRFDCTFDGDPLSFYATLRSINPAPFAAYIDTGECIVVSSSPERFIHVQEGKVETRPIKGTCPRGATKEEDANNQRALLESEKDRAELLMIVDLERNDLSRIAQTGTVCVPEIFTVETYATVHHLVATVTATLRPEHDGIDCVRATFPGGSITGAPKIRAMEIIDQLEPTQRNVYTGAIGYLGFDGNLDLNITIRTVVIKDKRAYFQVGGGIVWDSDPELEYQESLTKAQALIKALRS